MKNKIHHIIVLLIFTSITIIAQEKTVFDIARYGSVEEMESLIKHNSDIINTIDKNGFTPLILATYRNNEIIVAYLVTKIKDIDYNTTAGTALTAASYKGITAIVEILLNNKANPNIADTNGTTPLIYAAMMEHSDIIKLLIANGAKKQLKDHKGNSALQYALMHDNKKLIHLLK